MIATGTPEQIAANEPSFTGQFLRHVLPKWNREGEAAAEPKKARKGRKKEPAWV